MIKVDALAKLTQDQEAVEHNTGLLNRNRKSLFKKELADVFETSSAKRQ